MKLQPCLNPASWSDLQDMLFRDAHNVALERIRSPFIYRGLMHLDYPLQTSLTRLGGPYEELEFHLLRNFKKYAHRSDIMKNTDWDWLALAQHHGLPTRLLDWTYSPYVALHFATADLQQFDHDAVIWALNYEMLSNYLPVKLRNKLAEVGSNSFTTSMLDEVYSNISELSTASDPAFVVPFEPPSLDARIVNQYAIFTFMSHATFQLDEWLLDKPELYFRIRIPASLKWEIRDKLDQVNINERVLFPGFEGLSRWLKRHYSPKIFSQK